MITWRLEAYFIRGEHNLSSLLLIVAEFHLLPIRKGILFLLFSCLLKGCQTDGAVFFLYSSGQLKLGTCIEVDSTLSEQVLKVRCDVSASQVHSFAGVGQGVPLIYRDDMSDAISRVQNDTGGFSSCKST